MKFKQLSKLFNFFRHARLLDKKEVAPYHLLVIDGPASISISKLIVKNNNLLNLRFVASAHFLTRLDDSGISLKSYLVGWQVSTLILGTIRFIASCIEMKRILHVSQITRACESECMIRHIQRNASLIKNVIVFNERSPFVNLAISTAKSYGIATSCIQHGAVVENYFPIKVDRYFTWSDYYSKLLRQRTPNVNTICIGRLGYKIPAAYLSNTRFSSPLLVLQPANVSIERGALLSHFRTIIDICYSHFNEITLRPHPNDNIVSDIVSYIGDRLYSIDSGNMDASLSRHSITISIYSTVLLEAPHYGSVPIQYIEPAYSNELMQRCELRTEFPKVLTIILKNLKDKNYFSECLDKAKEYSESRMKPGDIQAFFGELEANNVDF